MLTVDIDRQCVSNDTPANAQLTQWAQRAYRGGDVAEVALAIVDSEAIEELNHRYRNKNSATNVLSFPADMAAVDGVLHLGDIVLCRDVIESQAKEQGKTTAAHWAHMTIHGMLHLQNYDHIERSEAETMEALETELLVALNFPDPYYTDLSHTDKHNSDHRRL